jgi:hypothetical protein
LVGGKKSEENKKDNKFLIFIIVFPTNQSEAELQIVSSNSHHNSLSLLK